MSLRFDSKVNDIVLLRYNEPVLGKMGNVLQGGQQREIDGHRVATDH